MATKKGFGVAPAAGSSEEKAPETSLGGERQEILDLKAIIAAQAAQLVSLQEIEKQQKDDERANVGRPASKERFRIVIDEAQEEGADPTVFIGYQGNGNTIKRGWEVDVPVEWLHILDNAVETRFVMSKDSRGMPTGLTARNMRRFPYRNYGMAVDAEGKKLMPDPVYVEGGDTSEVVRNS